MTSSGGATVSGSGGATTTTGSGGNTTTGSGGRAAGSGGATTTTGSGGGSVAGSGGRAAGAGGTAGARAGSGGAPGAGGAVVAGSGGTTGGVTVSASCKVPTWPTAVGSTVMISGTRQVSGTYDGKMAVHEGDLDDCSAGAQGSTKAIIEVADGGTVKNIVFGKRVGDGIHCSGSCTIENVWFPYVCDDAITMLGNSGKTMTIRNSGFKGARDKTIQHNGDGSTVVIDNVYVETAGKMYRSCGEGCSSSARRTVQVSNVIAIGVDQVVGVSTNDRATVSNVCAWRTGEICKTYQPGSDNESTAGANATPEGPSSACSYKASDSHALVDRVVAGRLQTDVLCPGPNAAKDGMSNATNCVSGFETCDKGCAPGLYGFKQINCSGGKYASSGTGCILPSDPTIASHLAASNAAGATMTVTNNTACTSQWAWGTDGAGKYCVCVAKPGYYQTSNSWYVWDCQTQWW